MAWYKSRKGWISGVIGIVYLLLDHFGYIASLVEIAKLAKSHWPRWSTISPYVAPTFFILAIIFFELERRTAKRPRPLDLNTLSGRTLQLRDEMQMFLDNAPPADTYSKDMTQEEILKSSGTALRVSKLYHGYELHFAERVRRIYHEFGERNVQDNKLVAATAYQIPNEECYRKIIERLSELAGRPEAAS